MESNYGYMPSQPDINEKMRSVLIDWIIEVHYKFQLTHETLFLCVHLIDKYLNKIPIHRSKLQLVGVAALLIACKYEEIFSPELRDFVYVTDKAFTKDDIINLETEMLGLFKFDITVPSSLKFFEILSQQFGFCEAETFLGFYLLELFLLDYRCLKYKPSLIACTVCYMVSKFCKKTFLSEFLHFEKNELIHCARDIMFLLTYIDEIQPNTVRKKYASSKYKQVARIKLFN
jgi:hypothetical protein